MSSSVQFLDVQVFDSSSQYLAAEKWGDYLSDFGFILTLFWKQYKVSYKNKQTKISQWQQNLEESDRIQAKRKWGSVYKTKTKMNKIEINLYSEIW